MLNTTTDKKMQFQSRSSEIHVLLTNFLHLIDLVPSDFHDEDECFVFADKKQLASFEH